MTAPELKPCPFCGGKAMKTKKSMDERMGYIMVCTIACLGCGARIYGSDGMDKNGWAKDTTSEAKAVTAWNTRADLPPPLPAALALPEIQALVEVVRIQSQLLTVGTCGRRGQIVGRRLEAALAALQEKP